MAETASSDLLTDLVDGVLTITFNRPDRKNALTPDMFAALPKLLGEAEANSDIRVVVFTGAGDAFCAGADLSPPDPDRERLHAVANMRVTHAGAQVLFDFTKPTIAKINGVVVGAGLNLALGCDLTYASDTARFSEIFAKRGLSLDWGGSYLLPRLVGLHKAKELALLADIISADEAANMGLINRVVAADELDAVVADVAARLAAGPPIALSMTKRLLNNSAASSMPQALEAESLAQSVNFSTEDTVEAIRAFQEKRTPEFRGRYRPRLRGSGTACRAGSNGDQGYRTSAMTRSAVPSAASRSIVASAQSIATFAS